MADSIQQTSPRFRLTRGDDQVVVISPVTLPDGRTLADWDTFTLTIRADPGYPRTTQPLKAAAKSADPEADGWELVFEVEGSVVGDTLEFAVAAADASLLSCGEDRYAGDVIGEGGAAGRVHILKATWVSVDPSVS